MKKFWLIAIACLITLTTAAWGSCQQATNHSTVNMVEEFMFSTSETGEIGELGWALSTTGSVSLTSVNGSFSSPGVVRLDTGATINTIATLTTRQNQAHSAFGMKTKWEIETRVRPQTSATQEMRWGLGRSVGAAAPTNGVFFEHDTAATVTEDQTVWVCVSRSTASGSQATTRTATDSTVSTGTWYWLKIARLDTNTIKYYINDIEVCSFSSDPALPSPANIPSGSVTPFYQVENLEAVDKQLEIDYFRLNLRGINR